MKITLPSREACKNAILSTLADGKKKDRKTLIFEVIQKFGYTFDELKDTGCNSISTQLKSFSGIIVSQLEDEKTILVTEDGKYYMEIKVEEKEQKDKKQKGVKKPKAVKKEKLPLPPITQKLKEIKKKYDEYGRGEISERDYHTELNTGIIDCINLAGGPFFEQLSLMLLNKCYEKNGITSSKLTGGPQDNGIDGIITTEDELGFKETIIFQAKTKENPARHIALNDIRRFVGVMTAERVTKGILISNSNFHPTTVEFAEKVPNLKLIDRELLIKLMKKTQIGLKINRNKTFYVDEDIFPKVK